MLHNKYKKGGFTIGLLVLAVSIFSQTTKEFLPRFKYSPNNKIIISGHRGGIEDGLPENSIEAFENVLCQVPAFFEVDPRLTKDSVVVLMHDASLERTSTGKGKLSGYTAKELETISLKNNDGAVTACSVPKLENLIKWSKGKTVLNLDKKDVPLGMTASLINKYNAGGHIMLTVHTGAEARFYYDRIPNVMLSAFCRNEKEYNDMAVSGVPWGNMIAYVGTSINAGNRKIVKLLHEKGVKCMVSFAPTIDKLKTAGEREAKYREEIAKHPDIIETDRPIELGKIVQNIKGKFDIQAHRGGAGLMPENSIPAMLNAVKLGATTLEMDLHLTRDMQVIVAHDAKINRGFTLKPDGSKISKEEADKLFFYHLGYDEIQRYDIGTKYYEKFPEQQKIETHIPLVSDLIDSVENYVARYNLSPVHYNIEIKSNKEKEKRGLIPGYKAYTKKAMSVLLRKNLGERLLVQSFDARTLNYIHKEYPGVRLLFIVGKNTGFFEAHMKKLTFTPDVYCPDIELIDQNLIEKCHKAGMKIISGPVDIKEDIQKAIGLQVDGFMTNYPDRAVKYCREKSR